MTKRTNPAPGNRDEQQKDPSLGVETLEPRVLLSATLGNLDGEDVDIDAEVDGDGEVDLGDLNSDGSDLFGIEDELAEDSNLGDGVDGSSHRGWAKEIQAWFGWGGDDSEPEYIRGGATGGLLVDNEAPIGEVDHFHVGYGETVIGSVLDNDIDPDGDTLTAGVAVGPASGTLSMNDDGTFEYVPDEGFSGLDRFWYKLDDGNGNVEEVEVCIFIDAPPNLVPIADDDAFTTAHNETVAGNLFGNDFDPDNDVFSAVLWEEPLHGTASVNADGTFEYTPNEGFAGQDTFIYRIVDRDGGGAIATVTIDVAEPGVGGGGVGSELPNQAPVTQVDHYHVGYDEPATGNVLANDSDPDGDTLTASVATPPASGTLELNADGTFTYHPNEGWSGLDRFWYNADDGNGNVERVEVCIVTDPPPNALPEAAKDEYSTTTNASVSGNVLDNDIDPDNDAMTVSLFEAPENGTVTVNPDGTFEYVPNEGFTGTDTFQYRVVDADGGGALAEVCIEVNEAANQAPVTEVDHYHIGHDQAVSANVLANDSDPDGDRLTATVDTPPEHGTLTLRPNGQFVYIPNPGWSGLDRFWYNADDGNGNVERVEVCIVTDPGPNALPEANKDEFATHVNETVVGNVLDNDIDPDNDDWSVSLFTPPENGTVVLNSDGTFEYTPNEGFKGTDTFQYRVVDSDGGGALGDVCIEVSETPNGIPDAVKDEFATEFGTELSGSVLGNDFDPDGDDLEVKLFGDQPENGTVTINLDGTFTYIPNEGFSGTDTFQYCVDDGNGGIDITEVCIEVGEKPNGTPDAVKDEFATEFGTELSGSVLGNDVDPDGDDLEVKLFGDQPENGTVTINLDGTFTYIPNEGFSGTDTFQYCVDDGNGGIDITEVCIEVGEKPNGTPDAVKDEFATDFGTELSGSVLGNDVDPDGDDLEVKLFGDQPENGTVTINLDGTFTYVPNEGFSGTDTFQYCVDDGNGGIDITEVCIEVGEPQPEKVFTYDVLNPPGSDAGGDIQRVTTTFNETTNELTFKMVVEGTDTDGFTLAINDGPNPKGNGDEMALFYFDNSGESPVVSAYNYNGQNNFSSYTDTPIATSLGENSPFSNIEVSIDEDGNTVFCFSMDSTAVMQHSDSQDWTGVSFNETIGMWLHPMEGLTTSYGEDGYLDSWNFDSQGWFDTANQVATCELVEYGDPDAVADVYTVTEGESVSNDVTTNDSDSEGDGLTVVAVDGDESLVGSGVAGSNGGQFIIDADGNVTFEAGDDFDVLDAGETAQTQITYTIDDGNGGTDTTTVTVLVSGDDDTEPVCVKEQSFIIRKAYNRGGGTRSHD